MILSSKLSLARRVCSVSSVFADRIATTVVSDPFSDDLVNNYRRQASCLYIGNTLFLTNYMQMKERPDPTAGSDSG
jgi:DNA polymerase II large subunit